MSWRLSPTIAMLRSGIEQCDENASIMPGAGLPPKTAVKAANEFELLQDARCRELFLGACHEIIGGNTKRQSHRPQSAKRRMEVLHRFRDKTNQSIKADRVDFFETDVIEKSCPDFRHFIRCRADEKRFSLELPCRDVKSTCMTKTHSQIGAVRCQIVQDLGCPIRPGLVEVEQGTVLVKKDAANSRTRGT